MPGIQIGNQKRTQMNVVIIGHVDHGKSTVVGRLLAETHSLPEGKLEEVKQRCRRNARPFEYAFLLDALKDEQDQGITIDSARCFFRSDKREYIIIDAPGHVEFLKNMISGAARAEAALLVIDANEGVQENSRRHGYLLSMLGISQIAVAVNKMDLVDYSRETFERIAEEYSQFLHRINLDPQCFIPTSARDGANIVTTAPETPWYDGPSVLEAFDSFRKEPAPENKPLRFGVQDIYKFTAEGDDRRIVAGRIDTGTVDVDDEVVFWPSGKRSRIASVEGFNLPPQTRAVAGQSTGFTLTTQIYIKPGELMTRADQPAPLTGTRFKANIVWLGRHPMVKSQRYKIKLVQSDASVWLRDIETVMDASSLATENNREQIERHDVAECILETLRPLAFDPAGDIQHTGRFVLIDNYEIAGGGIILENAPQISDRIDEHVRHRQQSWERSRITPALRSDRYSQRSALVLITGPVGSGKQSLAKELEEDLFAAGRSVYYLGLSNSLLGLDTGRTGQRDDYLLRLGEVAHLFTDAGLIFIAAVSDLDDYEAGLLQKLNRPNDCLIVNVGPNRLSRVPVDLQVDAVDDPAETIHRIKDVLTRKKYLEYYL